MEEHNPDWFKTFFDGAALDLWRRAATPEMTEAEADFLYDELACEPGQSLLDVPCGNGRHAVALAGRGLKITGVDLGSAPLNEASQHKDFRTVQQDMRDLLYVNEFDGAYCLGNSFGYFNADDTKKFLAGISRALKPKGCFALDTNMAAETVLINGGEKEWVEVDGIYMLVDSTYDPEQSVLRSRFVFMHNGENESRESTHWIFTVGEISRMLKECGLTPIRYYSSLDGDFFELGSDRLVLIAQKD